MGNFSNNKFDKKRTGNNRSFDRPQMHQATCSKCGKSCFVPFTPTGNRPIFCTDCFKTEGGAGSQRSEGRISRPSSDKPMYDAICEKCGNRCRIPFQPRPGRQFHCSHCFEQIEKGEKGLPENPRIQEQLDGINIKLGKILQLLNAKTSAAADPEKTTQEIEKTGEKLLTEEVAVSEKKSLKLHQ